MNERRLIEDFLPVESVGYEATREKLLRRRDYHISMLHLWWARRPLAAARAAVYAALVPAPEVIEADRQSRFFRALCTWGGPESAVRRARDEVLSANAGHAPKVLDMFAGGGAIPLEATRLGCEATALELNPVAHIIELCTLEYPQRFGATLARDVERWGAWLIERVRAEIGWMYPHLGADGPHQTTLVAEQKHPTRAPIAYLWTRTVPCPNPAARRHTVPLARQTWLAKKKGRYIALKIVPIREEMRVVYEVVEATSLSELGFEPESNSKRGSTTCPLCGASVDLDYVKAQGKIGAMSAEVMGVALLPPGGRGKTYVCSEEGLALVPDAERVSRFLAELADDGFPPPSESITASDTRSFFTPPYGLTTFASLFTHRQLVMLLSLCRATHDAHVHMMREGIDQDRAAAIATYLGLLIDRMTDFNSCLCRWEANYEKTQNTYSRQALPMTWDFSEVSPFGGSSGDLRMHLSGIVKVIEHCARSGKPVQVIRGSAAELPFDDASFDAVVTDPPYYDQISYSDLSDFFYVWLKRSVGHLHPEHLSAEVTPKNSEMIAAPYRQGGKVPARRAYEDLMARAFVEARRVLKPDGVLVCVYAHQTTAGWSTLIEAVRRAGFVVGEAWPIDTEMPTRDIAQGKAALASSIFLVGRPRKETRVGDWANDVRPELARIVAERVAELPRLGITGTDLVIAAVGAGMRAYTRFPRVEKPNGEALSPAEYLEEVEREVAEAVLIT